MLSADELDRYERDGFLVLPDFVSGDACDELRDRANELVAELLVVEAARDRAEAEKRELEAALRGEAAETEALLQTQLRQREAELEATMETLRSARAEIEALRG